MSEKKKRTQSNIWAYNAHGADDPFVKVLLRIANRDPARYIRPDGSINKMRLAHDVLVVGARKLCTDTGDTEGLRLIAEHEHLAATRAALREGKPLPDAIPTPAPASGPAPTGSQTSVTPPTEATSAPTTLTVPIAPAPKLPEQKKRIVNLVINESGHSRIRKVE